jgi:hypothetical protein
VDDQISAPVQNYIASEYANAIRVGYNKAYSNGRSTHIRFNDQETALYDKYRVNSEKTVETFISNNTDATSYGEALYLQYAGIFPTFIISTKNDFMNLALEDLIDVEVYVLPDGSYGTVRLEVLGLDIDLNLNTVSITGRYVSIGGTYPGKKLIKYLPA